VIFCSAVRGTGCNETASFVAAETVFDSAVRLSLA